MNNERTDKDTVAVFAILDPDQIIQVSKIGSLDDISFETIKEIGQISRSSIVKIIDNADLIDSLTYKLMIMSPDDPERIKVKKILSAFYSRLSNLKIVPKYGLVMLNTTERYSNRYSFFTIDSDILETIKVGLLLKSEDEDLVYQKNKLKLADDLDNQIKTLTKIELKSQNMCSVNFEFSGEIAPEIDKSTVYFAKL